MTTEQIRALGDANVLALTIFGEARGESIEGKVAVGCVVRNRLKHPTRFGHSYADVCLAPHQFSCWAPVGGEANYEALIALAETIDAGHQVSDAAFRECRFVAAGVISGDLQDRSRGASHYVTKTLYGTASAPMWVKTAVVLAQAGNHVFMVA